MGSGQFGAHADGLAPLPRKHERYGHDGSSHLRCTAVSGGLMHAASEPVKHASRPPMLRSASLPRDLQDFRDFGCRAYRPRIELRHLRIAERALRDVREILAFDPDRAQIARQVERGDERSDQLRRRPIRRAHRRRERLLPFTIECRRPARPAA